MRLFRRTPHPPTPPVDPEAAERAAAAAERAAAADLAAERHRAKLAAARAKAERERQAEADRADRERRQEDRDRRRAKRSAMADRLRPVAPLLVVNAATVYAQGAYAYTSVAPTLWPTFGRLALAITFAAALESVALYVQWHAHDALLRKAYGTAARLRRGAYLIAAAIGAINLSHWWADAPAAGVGFGLLSLLSPFLWGLHTRRVHNVRLLATDRARVDDCGVEFSARRRRAFPWRTWQAGRWAIDHGVTEPAAAWAGYNAERVERAEAKRAERAEAKRAERQVVEVDRAELAELSELAELAELADAPVSGAPVDLASVSKTAAIYYAHAALGEVPASRVVSYLSAAGVKVSESLVYKARRQVPAESPRVTPTEATPAASVNGTRPELATSAAN